MINMVSLNRYMWMKELGNLYNEGWNNKLTQPQPKNKSGWYKPDETAIGLSYKGTFGRGSGDMNVKTINTYEQEEDSVISKDTVVKFIDDEIKSLTDSSNDRVAILSLTTIKNKILKL